MKRTYSSGGSSPVPAGADDRVVEEDAAADVRVDQPLVPARGVPERIVLSLADPDRAEERAQVARAKSQSTPIVIAAVAAAVRPTARLVAAPRAIATATIAPTAR